MQMDAIKGTTLEGRNEKSDRMLSALAALVTGIALVLLVGFLPLDIMHEGAHDTRHSLSFPCH